MVKMFKRFYLFILRHWRTPSVEPAVTEQSEIAEGVPKSAPAKERVHPDQEAGEFYFRETILDQLEYYMECIERMRRSDPDSFDFYSQVGGSVAPEGAFLFNTIYYHEKISPWFRKELPAFGALFIGKTGRDIEANEAKKKHPIVMPRFFYFRKYSTQFAPPEIQRARRSNILARRN